MYSMKLEWLSLADNPTFTLPNKGFHIPNPWFWNLSYFGIQNIHLDTFKEMGKLRQLYLNNNKIVSVNNRVFRYLNRLQTLDLCYNAVQNINARVFSRLSELRSLSLCHKNVNRINITLLHAVIRIGKVGLEGNPCICDCDSDNVYSSCAKNKNCSLNLTCEFPDDLKRKLWSVINDLESKTTTLSAIASSLSERETTITTYQMEESIWPTMSSEKEVLPLEKDDWFWVMIVLSVLCSVTFLNVIVLCAVTYLCKRRYPNGDREFNEFTRHPQNENHHQVLETRETVFQH
jgi:Leucine-rich repeat (LRR) protein